MGFLHYCTDLGATVRVRWHKTGLQLLWESHRCCGVAQIERGLVAVVRDSFGETTSRVCGVESDQECSMCLCNRTSAPPRAKVTSVTMLRIRQMPRP